jgi:hypothetical protein
MKLNLLAGEDCVEPRIPPGPAERRPTDGIVAAQK